MEIHSEIMDATESAQFSGRTADDSASDLTLDVVGVPDQAHRTTNDSAPDMWPPAVQTRTRRYETAIEQLPKLGESGANEIPSWHEKTGWRFIRSFTPIWFTANMGTGIVAILLHNLPYNGRWLYWISVIFFVLNMVLFAMFTAISALRYLLYPGLWSTMMRHSVVPLFLGAFPIGLATIIEMIVLVCGPAWGQRAVVLAWALWWIDAVISIAICYGVLFYIMHVHDIQLAKVTAAWLLPIASAIVASAVGGVVAEALENKQHALWTVFVCYFLWGTAMPLSMSVLVIYLHRLTMHKLPPREAIASTLLPVAALGQGAFGILQIGRVAAELFPQFGVLGGASASSAHILYVLGWFIAMIMWSYGAAWLVFALASISRGKFPFNLGWWGFTFPLGVYAGATVALGAEMPSRFFTVLGTVLSVLVVLLWIVVTIGTICNIVNGKIFTAPDFERNKLRLVHDGVTHIVALGIQSECCVQETALGALDAGFNLTILEGAHSTYNAGDATAIEIEKQVEELVRRRGAKSVPYRTALKSCKSAAVVC